MKNIPVLKKPKEGQPCNGCGLCCMLEVCAIGARVYGEDQPAPCPGLQAEAGRFWCGVVQAEEKAFLGGAVSDHRIAEMLGIGRGCDAEDGIETEAWNKFSE